jgi:hypothetical protein
MFILRRGKHVLSNYFLAWFFELLPSEHTDEINDEFRLYQSLTAIPEELDTSQIYEEDHITADILWHELQQVKDVNGKDKFGLMASKTGVDSTSQQCWWSI